jgi:hypothetical protein
MGHSRRGESNGSGTLAPRFRESLRDHVDRPCGPDVRRWKPLTRPTSTTRPHANQWWAIMQGVAHTPEDGSMQVIAAWLSSLPPEMAYEPMGRPPRLHWHSG